MPDWTALNDEIKEIGSTLDIVRRKYLKNLSQLTGRNVIIYYSGWLQQTNPQIFPLLSITDIDKNAFMTAIHGLDRKKGLDLVLHTPGGDTAATESLVDYLRSMFGSDIRAIIPQLALSGGTMIALSCKSIVMGKQSSLGPIDPQISGIPAHGAIEEFLQAFDEIRKDPSKIPIWQVRIAQYPLAFIGECDKAIQWSYEMVGKWLFTGMFKEDKDKNKTGVDDVITNIVNEFGSHAFTKTHSRHISIQKCKEIGLKIETMEDDPNLQDAILTLHHITMRTLFDTPAGKIVENQNGRAYIQNVRGQ